MNLALVLFASWTLFATTTGSSRTPAVALSVGAELSPGWTVRTIERYGAELRVIAQRNDGESITFNVARREQNADPAKVRRSPFDVEGYSIGYEQTAVPMEKFEAAGRALGAIVTAGGDLSKVAVNASKPRPVAAAKVVAKVEPAVARAILRDMAGRWTGEGDFTRTLDFDGTLISETGTRTKDGKQVQSRTLIGYSPMTQRFWISHTDSMNTSMWSGWGEWNEQKKTITFDLDPTSEVKTMLRMQVGGAVETAEMVRDGKTETSVTLKKAQ